MKYLVTGGAGFIGSKLIDNLLENGNEVVCIDSFDNYYSPEIKNKNIEKALSYRNFRLLKIDIKDQKELDSCFNKNDIDLVFHLAARAGVRPSIENPKVYYENNVSGTLNLLEAIRIHNVQKMVFASSSSIYGNNKKTPFSEDDKVDYPISPYAATKKSCELICHTYHHLYDLDIFCLRLFTVYGPRQRPDLAINKFTELIMRDEEIPLYGDGTMKRDYTYIDDIVSGFINAAERVNGFDIINLGNSYPISLIELIKLLEHNIGKKAKINFYPQQLGDVNITYADISKAKIILNYNPSINLQNGLTKFIQWKKS